MKMYYGANKIIKKPVYGLGNPSNDYGPGFYLTPSKEAAFLWASRYDVGYVMTYELDLDSQRILELNHVEEESVLRWIALLASHRFDKEERLIYNQELEWFIHKFGVDVSRYDVVIGYRADDSYFAYSSGFVRGEISIETLSQAMKLGKLGLQVVLMSPQAFDSLSFVSSEEAIQDDSYRLFRSHALEEYHQLKKEEDPFSHHFIRDLMRKYGK